MKVINLLEWDISYHRYAEWCENNNTPVMRVSMTKFRMRQDDFLFFKLAFNPAEKKSSRFTNED